MMLLSPPHSKHWYSHLRKMIAYFSPTTDATCCAARAEGGEISSVLECIFRTRWMCVSSLQTCGSQTFPKYVPTFKYLSVKNPLISFWWQNMPRDVQLFLLNKKQVTEITFYFCFVLGEWCKSEIKLLLISCRNSVRVSCSYGKGLHYTT